MMEQPLVTALRYCGFQWKQIGAAVEYRGLRAPYQLTTHSVLHNLEPEVALLLNAMREQIRPSLLTLATPSRVGVTYELASQRPS